MRKNSLTKFIVLGFAYFALILNVFAVEPSVLSRINVSKENDAVYTLDLGFISEYKGKAFIQKQKDGSFAVFLPDTTIRNKDIKLIYSDKDIKDSINISLDEKKFTKNGKETNYIKLSIDTADGVSLKLLSNTVKQETPSTFSKIFNWQNAIGIIILFITILFSINIFRNRKENIKTTSYTSFPKNSYKKEKSSEPPMVSGNAMSNPQQKVLPKLNISKALKPTERNTFDCFELPCSEDDKFSKTEFKSTLKQTSNLLQQKTTKVKLKQTNPLKISKSETSDLMIPLVEDVAKEKEAIVEEKEQNNAELLSVLNITQNKGFYLTTVEETLALFGFINDNVFLLKKFKDLSQINLQARFYDKSGNNDLYIVRLDNYKAMIEISDTAMKELAKL